LTPSIAQISVLLRLPEVKPGKRIPLPNPLSISDQNLLLIYNVGRLPKQATAREEVFEAQEGAHELGNLTPLENRSVLENICPMTNDYIRGMTLRLGKTQTHWGYDPVYMRQRHSEELQGHILTLELVFKTN
jgi:hypothetical protein